MNAQPALLSSRVPVSTLRLSWAARQKLITLKGRTGIQTWNVLSRCALLLSLAEPGPPVAVEMEPVSNVEMSWATFAGPYSAELLALVRERLALDGLDPADPLVLNGQLRLHLHRGIDLLAARVRSLPDLLALAGGSP